jgi:hypothetical protein
MQIVAHIQRFLGITEEESGSDTDGDTDGDTVTTDTGMPTVDPDGHYTSDDISWE